MADSLHPGAVAMETFYQRKRFAARVCRRSLTAGPWFVLGKRDFYGSDSSTRARKVDPIRLIPRTLLVCQEDKLGCSLVLTRVGESKKCSLSSQRQEKKLRRQDAKFSVSQHVGVFKAKPASTVPRGKKTSAHNSEIAVTLVFIFLIFLQSSRWASVSLFCLD